ncbi:MAG: TonB-dependent receptor [Nannocystaceae bacterium]|nr:TonB-dependent receptor [Nannocystaceae bacterium]
MSGGPYVVERLVHDRVELELGGRYEALGRTALLGERDFLGQRAGGRLDEDACTRSDDGGARCKKTHHAGSATAGVLARPIKQVPEFTLRVDANSSARVPAIDEQYMNGAAPSFPVLGIGSSKLSIERTWGGSTTVQYDHDWLFAEGSAYVNYIDDYIYFRPVPQSGECAPLSCTTRGPLPLFAFDPINALFGGGEVRLAVQTPGLPFEVSANGAWVRAVDLTNRGFVTFVPPDMYSMTGRYLWPDTNVSSNGYLEINGAVADRQRRFDPEADFADPPSAYVLLGAGAGVEFPQDSYLIRLSLRGQNLLNRRYREYASLLRYFADQPGWGIQLRFAIEFGAGFGD